MTTAAPIENHFVGVGAARSGTTSLYAWLDSHPSVHMSPVKETNFFTQDLIGREGPYDQWSLRAISDAAGVTPGHCGIVQNAETYMNLLANPAKRVHGEISPSYLVHAEESAARIHDFNPDCRIVILLREPVSRAVSAHAFCRALARESLPFHDAIRFEALRIEKCWEHIWAFRQSGLYFDAVKAFLDHFGQQQLWVGLFEDLIANPQALLRSLTEFLDIEPLDVPKLQNFAKGVEVGNTRNQAANSPQAPHAEPASEPDDDASQARLTSRHPAKVLVTNWRNWTTSRRLRRFYATDVHRLDQLLPSLDIPRKWNYQ